MSRFRRIDASTHQWAEQRAKIFDPHQPSSGPGRTAPAARTVPSDGRAMRAWPRVRRPVRSARSRSGPLSPEPTVRAYLPRRGVSDRPAPKPPSVPSSRHGRDTHLTRSPAWPMSLWATQAGSDPAAVAGGRHRSTGCTRHRDSVASRRHRSERPPMGPRCVASGRQWSRRHRLGRRRAARRRARASCARQDRGLGRIVRQPRRSTKERPRDRSIVARASPSVGAGGSGVTLPHGRPRHTRPGRANVSVGRSTARGPRHPPAHGRVRDALASSAGRAAASDRRPPGMLGARFARTSGRPASVRPRAAPPRRPPPE
jgi:hypothetical protein